MPTVTKRLLSYAKFILRHIRVFDSTNGENVVNSIFDPYQKHVLRPSQENNSRLVTIRSNIITMLIAFSLSDSIHGCNAYIICIPMSTFTTEIKDSGFGRIVPQVIRLPVNSSIQVIRLPVNSSIQVNRLPVNLSIRFFTLG